MVDEQQQQPAAAISESNHWRSYGVSHPKKKRFLSHFAEHGSVTKAADAVGVARRTHYDWQRDDEAYAEAFADAEERYAEKLEAEADRRAVEGVDKPLHYQGEIFAHTKEYSDNLLMFRLKALKPEKYRERGDMTLGASGKQLRIVIDSGSSEPG